MFCCTLLYVASSFAIILMGKRELVALLGLSSLCLVIVVWLFLVVPWVCLQFVIVVFPYHTHLLFFVKNAHEVKLYVAYMRILHIDKIPPPPPNLLHFAFDSNSSHACMIL